MNDISEKRPEFFEGQFLGADDLEQLVTYVRDQNARHALGGHTWGIVAGLELVEQQAPSGELEVYLLPGYAVDGYGRAIVVINPLRLTVDLLSGQATGAVPVWLRYDEGKMNGVRKGFEVCAGSENYSRVGESYALEAGMRPDVTDQQAGVVVSGEAIDDARTAPEVFADGGPLICDASVPFQELPRSSDEDRWLIPIGIVGWQAGVPGKLVALTGPQSLQSRLARRYLGVVAEVVLAPGGVIRLRDRYTAAPPDGTSVEEQCQTDDIRESDLRMCAGKPEFNEQIWLEGRVRVVRDMRMFGSRLEFRDKSGTGYATSGGQAAGTPLLLQRNEKNEHQGQDLQVLIGESTDGRNRLVIGQTKATDDAKTCALTFSEPVNRVVVQDNGKVGVGTTPTSSPLQVLVTLEGLDRSFLSARTTTGHELQVGADKAGAVVSAISNDDLVLRAGGNNTKVTIKALGNVGVGTSVPKAKLDIRKVKATGGGSPLGQDMWLRAGDGGDTGRFWVEYGPESAPLLVLSDKDDPPRIQFQQVGAGQENNPDYFSWVGHARTKSPDLAIMGGRVGIGTQQPDRLVTLQGAAHAYLNVRTSQGSHEILIGADSKGAIISAMTKDDDLLLRAGGNDDKVIIKADGKVGIGTSSPAEVLDVRGNVKLGSGLEGDLFAPGSAQNLRIVVGSVYADGTWDPNTTGFTVVKQGPGSYVVVFSLPFFKGPPVVVATPVDSSANLLSLHGINVLTFSVKNVSPGIGEQNTAFNFMAFGLRL